MKSETLGFTTTLKPGSRLFGELILNGELQTKWMTKAASALYLHAVQTGLPLVKQELLDPNTRRAVLHGPTGACWIATQVMNTPAGYRAFCFYRSLDSDHLVDDWNLQTAIVHRMVGTPVDLTFFVTNYHTYETHN